MVGARFLNVDTCEEVEADQTAKAQAPGFLWLFAILVVGVSGFLETIF
ncbi:MAG: hypothetical protein ACKVG4_11475 [Longimicrobiales bacterium]|jgi:hypothetical protein